MDSAELHKPLTGNSHEKEKWTFRDINKRQKKVQLRDVVRPSTFRRSRYRAVRGL